MEDRVLADGFLCDLTVGVEVPLRDPFAAARKLGAAVVVMPLPGGLRALADDAAIYVSRREDAALGLAQLLLLRAGVGHRDADVTALADMMLPAAQ